MFTAKVYRVMVCSLSGTMEEVYVAKDVIRKWNQENAECIGKLFLLVDSPMEDVDVLIGIVGNWIDKPERVLQMVEAGKKVKLFFNAFQDPKNTIPTELEEMIAFKEKMQGMCSCEEYNGRDELGRLLVVRMGEVG